MNPVKAFLISSLVIFAVGCSVQSKSGGTAPGEATGFLGSKKDDLTVDNEKAFNGRTQVVIASFKVDFLEEKKAAAKAGGGLMGNGMGGRSSAKLKLSGVDAALMQKITDAAYADFIARLQSSGYTVVDRAALMADKGFSAASATKTPSREEASMFFGSNVTVTHMAPASIGYIYEGGIGFSNPMFAAAKYAEASKVATLFVNYTVDFANAEGFGGWYRTTSSVTVGQGISIPVGSGIQLVAGEGGTFNNTIGSVKLGQPVYSEETFGEIADTMSDAEKGAEVALNLATTLLGGGSNISRSYEVTAEPARYQAVASKVLGDASARLVGRMATHK